MGLVTTKLAVLVQATWRARATTALFAVFYSLWTIRGLVIGAGDTFDWDKWVPVRFHMVSKQKIDVDLVGTANYVSLRQHQRRALLRGPAVISVDCTSATTAAVRLSLEMESARWDDTIELKDISTGKTLVVSRPYAWRQEVAFPLGKTNTQLQIQPSRPDLTYRLHTFWLDAPPKNTEVVHFESAGPSWKNICAWVALGGGWWERDAQHEGKEFGSVEQILGKQVGYLQIRASHQGRHRVKMIVRPGIASYTPPRLTLDGKVVTPLVEPFYDKAIAPKVHALQLTFDLDLAKENHLAIELVNPILSPLEAQGDLGDRRRLGWAIFPNRMEFDRIP